jgi:hypothetical protein
MSFSFQSLILGEAHTSGGDETIISTVVRAFPAKWFPIGEFYRDAAAFSISLLARATLAFKSAADSPYCIASRDVLRI